MIRTIIRGLCWTWIGICAAYLAGMLMASLDYGTMSHRTREAIPVMAFLASPAVLTLFLVKRRRVTSEDCAGLLRVPLTTTQKVGAVLLLLLAMVPMAKLNIPTWTIGIVGAAFLTWWARRASARVPSAPR